MGTGAKKLTDDQAKELKKAFEMIDTDGNGFLDKEEIRKMLQGMDSDVDDAAVEEFLRNADQDGDGRVSFDEFIKDVCCGYAHTHAITNGGLIYSWGNNECG